MAASGVRPWDFLAREAEREQLDLVLGHAEHRVVLIAGEAGVGKSRLALHVLDAYRLGGGTGTRCVASLSLRDVPFGATVGLIPAHHLASVAAGTQQLSVYAVVHEHLASLGATERRPFVLCVDDLHHLDEASCALITQLVAHSPVQVLATYRTGEPLSSEAATIWSHPTLLRMELEPFSRSECERIVEAVLGAVTPEVSDALWQHSHGNALYLRELIAGSVGTRRLVQMGPTWGLAQPLQASTHLSEYLLQSVRQLPERSRSLADLLALCQPLPLAAFVNDLERSGVIVIDEGPADTSPADRQFRLVHPVYADVLRAHITVLRERVLYADAVRRLAPCATAADHLRLTVWRLDAGTTPPIDDLLAAARSAFAGRDLLLTRRLARAACAVEPAHSGANRLLSDSLYEMGAFAESAQVATDALGTATDPDEQAMLVASLYRSYLWGLDDADGAVAVADFAAAVTPTDNGKLRLTVAAANALAFSDRPRLAAERMEIARGFTNAVAVSAIDIRESLLTEIDEVVATQLGRTGDALARELPRESISLHRVIRTYTLTEHGRFDEAAALGEATRASVIGLDLTLDQMWAAANAARAHLMAGRLRMALHWANDALLTAQRAGLLAGESLIVSIIGSAAAQLGDVHAASVAEARAEALDDVTGFLRAERAVGRAWYAYVTNEHSRARAILREGAELARANGQQVSETFLMHESIRLGEPPDLPRWAELASATQSPLVRARAVFAAAVAQRHQQALAEAGHGFAALGGWMWAAEALTLAANLGGAHAAGHRSEAQRCRARGDLAITPMLAVVRNHSVELSPREAEIAGLAASGMSSKVIGDRLELSVRTVDNHLQRIYIKLGVNSRQDLATALVGVGER
jgi:DNA-binding CsgD family transcriptional regulator